MKNIKMLGITTKEGFEVRSLKRFPSMEWGDEGGLQADLYYKGDKVLQLYQPGDGGMSNVYFTELGNCIRGEISAAALTCLQRLDVDYRPEGKYYHLNAKTPQDITEDDWETLINIIEEYYDDVHTAAQSFRNGYKMVVAMKNNYQTQYLQYRISDITVDEIHTYMKKNGLDKKFNEIKILRPTPELAIL